MHKHVCEHAGPYVGRGQDVSQFGPEYPVLQEEHDVADAHVWVAQLDPHVLPEQSEP